MDYKQFIDYLKKEEQRGAYLFHGAEEYLKDHALSELIGKYLPGGAGDMNYNVFDEDSAIADIESAAATPPFLAEKRLITWKNPAVFCAMGDNMKSEALAGASQQHISLLGRLPRECILVYFVRQGVPAAHPLARHMKETGAEVLFTEPDKDDMPGYISRIAKQKGLDMDLRTAAFLHQFSGGDLLSLSHEIDKLAAFPGSADSARIMEVCTPSSNYNIFSMLKDLTSGNYAGALSVYRSLIDDGESPAAVIAMIARQFRVLAYYSDIEGSEKGKDYKKLEKILGVRDFVIKNMMRYARAMDDETRKRIVTWCSDADFEIKQGNMADEAAVEDLIMKLFAVGR